MYEKIAKEMNEFHDSINMEADDVEMYLRYGSKTYISNREARLIDELLEKYL